MIINYIDNDSENMKRKESTEANAMGGKVKRLICGVLL